MAKKRIHWGEVLCAFLADEKLSIRDVAKQFGLSFFTVRNHAHQHSWHAERQLLHRRAKQRVRMILDQGLDDIFLQHQAEIEKYSTLGHPIPSAREM